MVIKNSLINEDHEFYEVINAFPFISKFLSRIEIHKNDIEEGLTIKEFFKKKKFSSEEISNIINKLNAQVNIHLKSSNNSDQSSRVVHSEVIVF